MKAETDVSFKSFLPLIIVAILMTLTYLFGLNKYLSFETVSLYNAEIKAYVATHSVLSVLTYMVVYIAAAALSLPAGLFLTVLGGYLFPQPYASIYIIASATIGATIVFLITRSSFGAYLRSKSVPRLDGFREGFNKNQVAFMLLLRLLPIFPFWLVNIAPALFNIRLSTFIWTTALGIIPGVIVFSLFGSSIGMMIDKDQLILPMAVIGNYLIVVAFCLLAFAGAYIIYQKFFAQDDR